MALFTRGLTKVARLGVNSRIGAAVACYHKNVRLLFSLVFNFTGCRIATVVSRETQIILHARYTVLEFHRALVYYLFAFFCIFLEHPKSVYSKTSYVIVIKRLIARVPDFVLADSRNVNTTLRLVIFGLLHSQVFDSRESKSNFHLIHILLVS